ncbi:MAG: TerB family tellurite resistance protein [Flavobacteriaceae bacterium]|nr:TerB family tellurite resistance protein [Flavobacteriaceae bacterium]
MNTNWTKKEFKAYLLLYAAQADFNITPEERKVILRKVGENTYKKIQTELKNDNDYQAIKKIQANMDAHNYSKEFLEHLMNDIKEIFFSDGTFDILERNMLMFLKKIVK